MPFGPRPASAPPAAAHLSGQRAAVLDRLREQARGSRIADLAAELELHPNTIREHLDALTHAGLVERDRAEPSGRGRPAWLYSAVDAGVDSPLADPRLRDYAGLAMSLSATLTRISTDLEHDAVTAGIEWGRELAAADSTEGTPAERLLAVLAQLGFAPEAGTGTEIALTQCPLLDAAHRYPEVVCRVHLGIVRGALEVFGGEDAESAALAPFAAAGSCRLELPRSAEE